MGSVTRQRALQHLHAVALGVHAAACAVCERNDTINVGIGGQCRWVGLARELVCYGACCCRRTIDRRQDANVVARGHPAIGPLVTHEAGVFARRGRFDVGTHRVVPRKTAFFRAHPQVVRVYMLTCGNGFAGKTDDLVVPPHRLSNLHRTHSHFVPRWNQTFHRDVFNRSTTHQLRAGNQHVISGVQTNEWVHKLKGSIKWVSKTGAAATRK